MNTAKDIKKIPGEKYKAVLSNRIYLSRTKELHDTLIKELTYSLPSRIPGGFPETYCDVTRINNNILTIPIGRIDLIPEDYIIEDKRVLVPVDFPEFKFELRESQKEVVYNCGGNGFINANPSYGKTFSAIALARELGQKTLVIVHTAKLRKQWIDEVRKTLDIDAGEIGAGKNKTDSIIVIATMQSLKNKLPEVSSQYGTTIVDEAHHIGATVFKGILDSCRSKYKIGLSATMWRKDGKHIYFRDYFGGELFQPKDENRIESEILIVKTDIPFSSKANTPWATRVNELMFRHDYMELVVNLSQAQAKRGHKVLTVSNRVDFLETCGDILDNFQVITGETASVEPDIKNYDGILGSGNIFAEGINIPPLSSLIMAYPINNRALLKQLIGRIERPFTGKMQPQAIDIWLSGRTAKAQAASRMNFYVNEGYRIKYI